MLLPTLSMHPACIPPITSSTYITTVVGSHLPETQRCCRGGTGSGRWSSFPAAVACPAGAPPGGWGPPTPLEGRNSTWVASGVPPGPRSGPARTPTGGRCPTGNRELIHKNFPNLVIISSTDLQTVWSIGFFKFTDYQNFEMGSNILTDGSPRGGVDVDC